MKVVSELWAALTPRERRAVLAAQALALVMAFSTLVSVAAIAPFFAVLGNPAVIGRHRLLHVFYAWGGFHSWPAFVRALGIAFVLIVLTANLVNAAGGLVLNRLALRIGNELQACLFREYLSRPYLFHTRTHSAMLYNRVVMETSRVTSGILQSGFTLITQAVTGALIVACLLFTDPLVCLVLLAVLIGGYLGTYLSLSTRLLRIGRAQSDAWSERGRIVNESFAAIRELLLAERSDVHERLARVNDELARSTTLVQLAGQSPRYVMESVAVCALVTLALLLASRPTGLGPAWGELTFIGFAAYRLLPALQLIFACAVRIRADEAALLTIAPDVRAERARASAQAMRSVPEPWPGHGAREIRLEQIGFRYPDAPQPALEGIDLCIEAGATIGIVGGNAAGKSTLLDIIAALLEPTSGVVRIDGIALCETNRAAWHTQMAYVPQRVCLLDASLEENVAFGTRQAVDRGRLLEALRETRLEEFVATLPAGTRHRIGEQGIELSGGQRQRLGIARALYRGAPVLLLDEPSGALDARGESELLATLQRLHGRCTIVVVTHSRAAARICDRLYELERGCLVNGDGARMPDFGRPARA